MSNELTAAQNKLPQLDAESLITKALETNASPDALEKMLDLRERINKENARSAFYQAMTAFQAQCPVIKKERKVKGKNGAVRYTYASLEDIITQVSPILEKNGLSFSIDTRHDGSVLTAVCTVRHILGHSSDSSFSAPIDKEAFMNEAQKSAAAQSYAKRYAFMNALGILTGDNDNDASELGSGPDINEVYKKFAFIMSTVLDNCQSIQAIKEGIMIEDYSMAAEAWFELEDDIKKVLWVAPTKGGPFSSKEREVIKSTEFREAFYGES